MFLSSAETIEINIKLHFTTKQNGYVRPIDKQICKIAI